MLHTALTAHPAAAAMLALILSPLSSALPQLRLEYGASVVPHPAKARTGGEDAHLAIGRLLQARGEREVTGAFGVFDGVGAWVNEGVDSGIFSRTLARQTRDALSRQSWASSLDLTAALSAGLQATHEVGSTTACLLSFDRSGVVHALNLGDSGFRVLSRGDTLPAMVKARSSEQTHDFNYPYQLGTGSKDSPQDGDQYELRVAAGDLVVLGSDGVWDNLFDSRLCELLGELPPDATALALAQAIAAEARAASLRHDWQSPFALAASRHDGQPHEGGKLDDVTVVCVKVLCSKG